MAFSSSSPPRPGAMFPVSILFLTFFVLSSSTYETNISSADQHAALVHSYPTNKTSTDHPNPNGKKPPQKRSPPPPSPPPPSFEYYLLELIWPASFCQKLRHPKCIKELPKKWVIHGLWPQGLDNCDPKNVLDTQELKDLRGSLQVKWPSLSFWTNDDIFWKKEWSKHGTCSGLGHVEYFQQTLNFFDKIGNLKDDLYHLGFRPGNSVNPATVQAKYKSYKPRIKCYDKTTTPQHQELMGVFQFKFYKNGTQENMVAPTNCTSTSVEYPLKTQLIG